MRERPTGPRSIIEDIPLSEIAGEGALLGLPETQSEVDNLTEYNTAHNRRISMLGITDDANYKKNKNKRKRKMVTFNEEEIIINPEDIDPSVGRFRNLIQSVIVQPMTTKRQKLDVLMPPPSLDSIKASHVYSVPAISLYQGISEPLHDKSTKSAEVDALSVGAFGSKFMILPNPAPEVSSDIIGTSAAASGKAYLVIHFVLPFINYFFQLHLKMKPRKRSHPTSQKRKSTPKRHGPDGSHLWESRAFFRI